MLCCMSAVGSSPAGCQNCGNSSSQDLGPSESGINLSPEGLGLTNREGKKCVEREGGQGRKRTKS